MTLPPMARWKGQESAQRTRRKMEDEVETTVLAGGEVDLRIARLQLEVSIKLTRARLLRPPDADGADVAMDRDVLVDLHQQIDSCIDETHAQLLLSTVGPDSDAVAVGSVSEDATSSNAASENARADVDQHADDNAQTSYVWVGGQKYVSGASSLLCRCGCETAVRSTTHTCSNAHDILRAGGGRWYWKAKGRWVPYTAENQQIESAWVLVR